MDNEYERTESNSKELFQNPSMKNEDTKIENECSEKKSILSLKSKKSSNLLSALVRKTKRCRNKNSKSVNNLVHNLNFIQSTSSLGTHTEEDEIELNVENYEKPLELIEDIKAKSLGESDFDKCIHSAGSENSVQSTLGSKRQFLRRFLKKRSFCEDSTKPENIQKDADRTINMNQDLIDMKKFSIEEMQKNEIQQTGNTNKISTSYINFDNAILRPSLESGLQAVQALANRLQDSESHLMRLLTSFIKDPSLQKELVEILFQHSKLQWETEKRTASLTNDMWFQQIEIGRTQERALQDTLTSLVKQNRQLQVENEVLFRKHEKVLGILQSLSDTSSKHKHMDCDKQIEHILKHNEDLQYKLEAYHRKIENLEGQLYMLQKHNENVEHHLRHSASHVQNLKAMFARSKMGYELEIASLNKDLQKNNGAIQEGIEEGRSLLEDLGVMKGQLKNFPLAINWPKFNHKEREIARVVRLSRCCLTEFTKQIISLHSELCLKDKAIEALQLTNSKLENNMKKSSLELDGSGKKIDNKILLASEKSVSDTECHNVEKNINVLEDKLEAIKKEHELEKFSLLNTISEYEKLDGKIVEKNKLIEQTKLFISNITSENIALRGEIDGLNRLLRETGAGDVVQELSLSRDQLYFYKTQYYQLLGEKEALLEKQTLLENERKDILSREETNYRLFQKQITDMENINHENSQLRQQFETEHQTVLSLQIERMKYLEEKNMLKSIFTHMKSELKRIQKLEGTVIDLSKEASKLALVAEYNEKLGSKLKNEILDKDKTILELRSSVEKLNDIELQHTKDKLSLCYEISEICQIKEHLSDILSVEVQKNYALDDAKKEITHNAYAQIQKYEQLQKNDRSAMKSVIKDLKSVVALKNTLQRENEKLKEEIKKKQLSENSYVKRIDGLVFTKNEQELLIKDLKKSQCDGNEALKKMEEKLSNETAKYNSDLNQLKQLIIQLRREKDELDNSVKYLQNNTQKLHNDLNGMRKCEKELQDHVKKCLLEKQEMELEHIMDRKKLEDSNAEKEKLSTEISNLNSLCEKMLDSIENNMRTVVEKEELFKQELEDSRTLIVNLTRDIESLKTMITEKNLKITQLDEEYSQLKQKEQEYRDAQRIKESLELEFMEMKSKNMRLDTENKELQNEYDSSKLQIEQSQQAIKLLQNQLKAILEQNGNDYYFCQRKLEESSRKNQEMQDSYKIEINNLRLQINDLSERLENEKCSYAALSLIYKESSAKFIKSIEDAVDEKNSLLEKIMRLNNFEEDVKILASEKSDLQQQVTILLDGMNESKNRINTLNQDKESLQKALEELHKRYNDILKKCLSLENQLLGSEFQSSRSDYDNMQQQILQFKSESQDNQNLIASLRNDIANLEHTMTTHEFQKSELTLRLHEIQRKFETEQSLCQQMKNTHRLVLTTVLQMKDDEKIEPSDCNNLIHMVQSNTNHVSD